MIIAIEGADGVGKTTVAKLIAQRLNFIFIEKPLHYLLDNDYKIYIKLRDFFNNQDDRNLSAWFYGLNYMLVSNIYKSKNIVTDRYFLSMYSLSYSDYNSDIYDLLIKKLEIPVITIILKASYNVIYKRLINRNSLDNDIRKLYDIETLYNKMHECVNKYNIPYIEIDTSNFNEHEVSDIIISKYKNIISSKKYK